jgi:hypothetical protein
MQYMPKIQTSIGASNTTKKPNSLTLQETPAAVGPKPFRRTQVSYIIWSKSHTGDKTMNKICRTLPNNAKTLHVSPYIYIKIKSNGGCQHHKARVFDHMTNKKEAPRRERQLTGSALHSASTSGPLMCPSPPSPGLCRLLAHRSVLVASFCDGRRQGRGGSRPRLARRGRRRL